MPQVRYVGPSVDGVDLADPQVHLPRNEWVDVPAEVAKSLSSSDDFESKTTKTPSGKEG